MLYPPFIANILVNQNCDIRICDFGMARGHIDNEDYDALNLTQYVSTRWYRAPEIMLSRNSYNKSSEYIARRASRMIGSKWYSV